MASRRVELGVVLSQQRLALGGARAQRVQLQPSFTGLLAQIGRIRLQLAQVTSDGVALGLQLHRQKAEAKSGSHQRNDPERRRHGRTLLVRGRHVEAKGI
jgi:hypothetical protein